MGLFETLGTALFGSDPRADMLQRAQGSYGSDISALLEGLQRQAEGKQSASGQMLKAGLGRNVAAEQSMAASGRGNPALRQRLAGQRIGNLRAGLSGDMALAGAQERAMANQQLAALLAQLRGQNMQGTMGLMQQPTPGERLLGLGSSLGAAALMSDRNAKTDVRDADAEADTLLEGLKAYSYRYKDARHGKGRQLGVMAQDLEKAGLPQAVIATPAGKAVDTGKLTGALAAAAARLHQRVAKLEAARGG